MSLEIGSTLKACPLSYSKDFWLDTRAGRNFFPDDLSQFISVYLSLLVCCPLLLIQSKSLQTIW